MNHCLKDNGKKHLQQLWPFMKKPPQKPVQQSHRSEGRAPETNSPPHLSDSLCCKNNREITNPTHTKYEGGVQVHALLTGKKKKNPQGRIKSGP